MGSVPYESPEPERGAEDERSEAFAAPGPESVRCSASRSCSPARSANLSTGDNPAHDTRFGSSKTAVDS